MHLSQPRPALGRVGSPRIGFLAERRYLTQNMPGAVLSELAAAGVGFDVLVPDGGRFDVQAGVLEHENGAVFDLNSYDLVVARNRNALGLAMLSYAEAAGIPTLNTHSATRRIRNKAKMSVTLAEAGIPAAPAILADYPSALAKLPADWFPLVLKATYGNNSQGLRLVRRPEELADVHWPDELVLAQRYVTNDGFDLKLYVCGRKVWAVRKPSPFNNDPCATSVRVECDDKMTALARRCGELFGLEIFGVDTIDTPEGPAVIEVNEFPNFTHIAEAPGEIARYVLSSIGRTGGANSGHCISTAAASA